ncbi:restriction endonuclease subunit S [Pseudomonas entomophila]|uniref:restriction endonuclease subunit S n=1 Tax=Pseudomonas entomophila TaxID=312306 RepID=UPI001BCDE85A|nr:restriction endonuclease subunit S [Pseudomonas entomophila]QVM92109.1 restriction endonuclease subunit S [Pseudomonas entomophila]
MAVKPGYKLTRVGVIPEEWGVKPFGALFSFRNGVNADKSAYGQGVRFINVLEPITYSHIHGPEIQGQVTLPEAVSMSYEVRRGDVLFNRTSETQEEVGLAATYLGSERVVFGGFVIRGRPIDGNFDPVYSGYALRAPWIRSQIIPMGQGAIRANIGQSNLSLVVAPVPPLSEQRVIATALSDIDALLGALERLIAKKRNLKQATMQQLFTGETRLPGFHGEWVLKRLGDLAEMGSGGTPTSSVPAYYDGNIPWVSISDMTQGGKYINSTDRNLTRLGFASCAAQMFPTGTVLYAMYASLGECSIAGIPLCSSQAILGIRPGESLNNQFLYYYLTSLKPVVKSLGQQGTQANLNKGMVQDFRISLPSLQEQTAIATILTDMDAELASLEQRLVKTRNLKQGMMQELLTGRTRLL